MIDDEKFMPFYSQEIEDGNHKSEALFVLKAYHFGLRSSDFRLVWHNPCYPLSIKIFIMGNTKDLTDEKAIEKIRELADGQICLMCTVVNGEIVSRPMGTQDVDEEGHIWFFSAKNSEKNQQIHSNDKVYLMYKDESKNHYLSLNGHAETLVDRQKIEEYWSPLAKAWFEEGKDDPNLSLIKFTPEEGHYWDTKNGKLVTMLKIAVAAITGHHADGGVEGDLTV